MLRYPTPVSAVALTAALLLAACGGGDVAPLPDGDRPRPGSESPPPTAPPAPPSTSPPGPIGEALRVVVDTDMSTDDLMAIAMLIGSPLVEVAAVTITGAFVRCPGGADVMLEVLAALGVDDIPVACGATGPLVGSRAFPADWRDLADSAWGIPRVPAKSRPAAGGGVALLRTSIEDGADTVIVLGPHTNLATLLRESPETAGRIDQVLTMGGAVDVPGNVYTEGPQPPTAEWNIYVDPVAAAEVFATGLEIVMVGLDATNEVPITGAFVDRLRRQGSGTAVELMLGMIERNKLSDAFDSYFWDQLAVAVLLDPAVVRLERTGLRIVTADGPDSGRTVRDPQGPQVFVAVGADRALLENLMIASLSGK